ncbi:MAG: hypothetical protein QOG91_600 [Candidatus Parcubacteria bacterium]|jgi:hypothetical protein|nr:hypothetical protein [Candidatus Parcubacteria bacterium]
MTALLQNPLLVSVIVLAAATIILLGLVIRMHFKLRRFLAGFDSDSVSDSLTAVAGDLKQLQRFREEMEAYLTSVEKRLRKSVQSVETVRFNPFKGMGAGGNQSFATAFLTEKGDGVVISSLYARDHASVFAKPIVGGGSEHEMSDEEREALANAKTALA